MTNKPKAVAKRNRKEVSLTVEQSIFDYRASIKSKVSIHLTSIEARTLATDLVYFADQIDAKAAQEREAEARRAKWREREIASGRMKAVQWK